MRESERNSLSALAGGEGRGEVGIPKGPRASRPQHAAGTAAVQFKPTSTLPRLTARAPPSPPFTAEREIGASAPGEVQLDHDVVVVREEQLVDRWFGDVVLAVFDAVPLQLRLDPVKVAREKREMVERPGIARRSAADRVLPRHQMHHRHLAAIEPIAREIEIRPEPLFEPQDVAVEIARRFQIVGLYRDMVQYIDPHGGLLRASR